MFIVDRQDCSLNMVRLTQTLCKYIPDWYNLKPATNSYFEKQKIYRLTRYARGRSWNCHRVAINRFEYNTKVENYNFKIERRLKTDIMCARIAAACEEHEYKYPYFVSTLPKFDILLNRRMLSQLAIYEPRTFASLVDISKELAKE